MHLKNVFLNSSKRMMDEGIEMKGIARALFNMTMTLVVVMLFLDMKNVIESVNIFWWIYVIMIIYFIALNWDEK